MDFPGHFQHIFKQLNHQRLNAQLCDCVVVVGGQSFQAHRSILAACSSHFRALLSSTEGGEEGRRGPGVMHLDPEIVTPEAFSTLLDMIYTSSLSVGGSDVMDVLLAASHLHLNAVVKACKLYLSKQNFPTSPPKGWRSVQQQQQQPQCPTSLEANVSKVNFSLVTSAMEEDIDQGRAGLEVSQSGEVDDKSVRKRQKRKSQEDAISGTKRTCRPSMDNSPTVTMSTISRGEGGEDLSSPDCLKTNNSKVWASRGEEEEEEEVVEVKCEKSQAESEEIQLPSQSDSGVGGMWGLDGEPDGDAVVRVKVGEEGPAEEEPKMEVVEVKRECLSSYSPDLDAIPNSCPPSPLEDSTDHLNTRQHETFTATEGMEASLKASLCHHSQGEGGSGNVGEESVDGEGLDSLSELAFSCFLNASGESVMGALDVEDSLATLTAAATAAAAAASDAPAPVGDATELCQNSEEANPSSSQLSDPQSSLIFPVASLPLQQLLPTQAPGFSDTLILQPAQSSLFLRGIKPGLSLDTSAMVQPSPGTRGKGCGTTTFRRIAPKAVPGSESSTDPDPSSSSSSGEAGDRPSLTRASEDVLSKCKKAAAEDLVLLVEGERKYACKICCKTFMNLTDCKKHIRVHTGEKPYPCPKCGKRFSQSSHLYKHSKNSCLSWRGDQPLPDTLGLT